MGSKFSSKGFAVAYNLGRQNPGWKLLPRRLFDHPGADLVELGNRGMQVLLRLGQSLKQLLDLLLGKALDGGVHHLPGERDQLGFQRASLGGEMDMPFAAILLVLYPADRPLLSHVQDRAQRGRLHGADATGELALVKPVLIPQRPEEVPHAERDAVRLDLQLKEALQGPMGRADLVADALRKRKIGIIAGGLAARLGLAGSGLLPRGQWRPHCSPQNP